MVFSVGWELECNGVGCWWSDSGGKKRLRDEAMEVKQKDQRGKARERRKQIVGISERETCSYSYMPFVTCFLTFLKMHLISSISMGKPFWIKSKY